MGPESRKRGAQTDAQEVCHKLKKSTNRHTQYMAFFPLASGWNAEARQKLQRKLQIKPILIILSLTKTPQDKELHCSSANGLDLYTGQLFTFPWHMKPGIGENVAQKMLSQV